MSDDNKTYCSKLALFQRPYVENAVNEIYYVDFAPRNSFSRGSSIEFNIAPTSPDYIDLSKSRLRVKARILQSDGKPIGTDNNVGFVNLTLHSLFRQVDLMLQGKIISPDIGVNYPYKAILDVILNYGFSAKESQLQSELYFKDEGGMDNPPRHGNPGLEKRYILTKTGLAVAMEGPLHLDIAQQDRPLLNGVGITLKMYPNSDKFLLMSDDKKEYKVDITEVSFKVCYVKVADSVILAQNEVLKSSPALYPFWKSNIKTFSLAKGISTFTADDIFHGNVPSKVILGFVRTEAYSGSYSFNPFNFIHSGVNFIEFAVNGKSVPEEPLQPNFANLDFVTSYLTLFKNKYPQHRGNFIERDDYDNGYSLFLFDIQGEADGDLMSKSKEGISRLQLRFSENTQSALTVIVYALFPGMVYCDQSRNVWW